MIELDTPERELVALESAQHHDDVGLALQAAAARGSVPAPLHDALAALLEQGLGSGRIRACHGAHLEMAGDALYARTAPGRERQAAVREANLGLAALEGHVLESLSLSSRGPGRYTLTVSTPLCRLVLALGGAGAEVKSVELAL